MRSIFLILLAICLIGACRERYGLPIAKGLFNSLVVEGNILKGDTTVIRLSRTSAVADRKYFAESGASVRIEGDDNSIFPLSETDLGIYKVAPVPMNPSARYRLRISSSGKEYESDWTSLINTANIDSVSWERDNGVEIFVESSGKPDDNRYYKWDYDEVWDFYSRYESQGYFTYVVDDTGRRTFQCLDKVFNGEPYNTCIEANDPPETTNDTMFHCWMYKNSTSINVASTAVLTENKIRASVRKITDNGFELTGLYTILVKQTGLSKDAYEFYKILKGNSEGMGSIFDAQPSQLKTNLRCTTDPTEIVLGYINTTTVKSKRIYINRTELRDWHYFDSVACIHDTVVVGEYGKIVGGGPSSEQVANAIAIGQVPGDVSSDPRPPYRVRAYKTVSKMCIDCRARGGIHKKPEFWPQ